MSSKTNKSLQDKTVFLTGGSRGIGQAIAKRLAEAGANIVICSKSSDPHPTLPGTIHETAKIVQDAGGKALPIVVDVRDDENIQSAVAQAVNEFGGIDICINNAGAFWMQPTAETSTKRHDLLFSINERATFLVTKACHPYLKKSDNGHVLNLSPPLDLKPVWFQHTSPYSVSKYAMSLYALGWSKEFAEDGIAVNTLWPRVGVETPAAIVHGGDDLRSEFRKPSIMADAAFAIVSKDASTFTGNFCIDDSLLADEGVTDFEQYSVVPGSKLVPDYYIPDDVPAPPGVKLSKFRLYDID
ncbi:short chain dehydrogenase [Gammaproteobacteria bacterium 45_16_T64]|nr:short chain dehydrogenase [Gammaproteobacteria bacterium 45_16_T64]